MNLITDTWRGLVRRKLWPVALLLVGALAAVPVLLAKTPDVAPPPPANAVANADEGMPTTYVTSAGDAEIEGESSSKRRRTLGSAKDPFEPAPLPKVKKKKTAKKSDAADKETSKESSSDADAKPSGGGAKTPTTPVTTATPTPTPTPPPPNTIRVRFTKVSENGSTEAAEPQLVRRLEVLPDEDNPVVVFRGLAKNGKVATFELTGNVVVEGDGQCEPTPELCGTLKLRAGETAFITVTDTGASTDAQYQLDVVKINAK